jgi:RAD51-like protein 2
LRYFLVSGKMDLAFATLSVESRRLLRKAGFKSPKEVLALATTQLARELGVDVSAAARLVDELRGQKALAPRVENAFELVQNIERSGVRHLTSFCRSLDEILDGGLPRGAVTELCGAPGAGKTQVCMQLAVSVSIPETFAGLDGEALYLDTEGSFSPERAKAMASAVSASLASKASSGSVVPSADDILSRIHVARAHDRGEQLAFVHNLGLYLRAHPRTRLIVLDSVAHHFRHDYGGDVSWRGKILARMAQELNKIAHSFDVVVLCTNHMTTRGDSSLVPALGEHWYHGVTNRIVLTNTQQIVEWRNPRRSQDLNEPSVHVPLRKAEIVKASSVKTNSAEFVVVQVGIRPNQRQHSTTSSSSAVTQQEDSDSKRFRPST